MTFDEVLEIVISRLGENYKNTDNQLLINLLKEKIFTSEMISNRIIDLSRSDENLKLLSPEIIQCTIQAYQQRGVESVKSQSELGNSSTFIDVNETLRNDIIKNGKRVIF